MLQQGSRRLEAGPLFKAVLTIDDTTAHITASLNHSKELLVWFSDANIRCTLRWGEGVGGLDVIDFENPSPMEEQRIRATFAAWRREAR